jgi:hypothetical protein
MVSLSSRMRWRCCWALAGLVAGAGAALSLKAATPESPPSLLHQVVPRLTGNNGYEELVAAEDALQASKRFSAIEAGGGGLDAKRRMLRDPPVMRALDLIRRGLAKPVSSPRASLSSATPLPELGHFRDLARLLVIQQYVLFADGRVPEAIETARLGWRLGTAIQTDTLVSGLVGTAVLAITTRGVAGHLDQLSERDCDLLYRACLERLREPDPALRMLEAERNAGRVLVAEIRAGTFDLASLVEADPSPGPEAEASRRAQQTVADLKRLKSASAEEYALQLTRVQTALDHWYDRVIAELRKPAWQRALPASSEDRGLVAGMVSAIAPVPMLSQVSDKYAQVQAEIRLLACHAAILRYKWEQDRLPASLAALNVDELTIDPFTGRPLQYEPRGARYRLTSVGPLARADDPKAVDGRRPVSVVPGEEPGILRTQ